MSAKKPKKRGRKPEVFNIETSFENAVEAALKSSPMPTEKEQKPKKKKRSR